MRDLSSLWLKSRYPKNHPSAAKAALILRHLWHATHPPGGFPGRALSKLGFCHRLLGFGLLLLGCEQLPAFDVKKCVDLFEFEALQAVMSTQFVHNLLKPGVIPQIQPFELPEAVLLVFFLISELPEILVYTAIPDGVGFRSMKAAILLKCSQTRTSRLYRRHGTPCRAKRARQRIWSLSPGGFSLITDA